MVGENENMDLPFADETLLARWLSGELTDEERRQVEAHPHFADWQQLARSSAELQAPAYDEKANWQQLKDKRSTLSSPKKSSLSVVRWWPAIAASLLLAIVATFLLLPARGTGSEQLIATSSGEQVQQQLPDASLVTLNAESSIAYNSGDWADDRKLELEGEAFFQVEEGSRFLVQTSLGEVEVLGTSFNVYARPDGFKVYCFTGRVAVHRQNGGTIQLGPGQGVSLVNGQRQQLFSREREAPGWTRGETNFRNAALTEIFAVVERQFGVEVEYENLPAVRYTGPLPHADLEEALLVFCTPMKLRYELLDGQRVRISPLED